MGVKLCGRGRVSLGSRGRVCWRVHTDVELRERRAMVANPEPRDGQRVKAKASRERESARRASGKTRGLVETRGCWTYTRVQVESDQLG